MSGWYIMHRGWMESGDFKREPFTDREAFLWSIEQAAFEPHTIWSKGVQIALDRGEFVTSIRDMAKALSWSEKRTRGFGERMSKAGKWAQRRAQGGAQSPTIVTVCNYAEYQAPQKSKGSPNGSAGGAPRALRGHTEGTQDKEGLTNGNERERRERASPLARATLPLDEAVAIWSAAAKRHGWKPQIPELNADRKKRLGARLREHGLDGWREAVERAEKSEMFTGHDPPGWFNFAFLLSPTRFLNTKEGNYDQKFSHSAEREHSNWGAAYDAEMPC